MRYSVSVAEVLPSHAWSPDRRVDSALVGVSVANPNFRGRRLQALLQWAAAHANRCFVLIGDDLYGISARVKQELEGCRADPTTRATELQISEVLTAIAKFSPGVFELVRWSELRDESSPFRSELLALFDGNESFRKGVIETARDYLHMRGRRSSAGLEALCTEYVIEEMSGLATIVARGTCVEFYPGPELRVLRAVANGEYPNISEPLRRRINVSLELRRHGSHQ